ncbi:MAG: c-type cytochrome, partial [Betaproteobacteria bacterium]
MRLAAVLPRLALAAAVVLFGVGGVRAAPDAPALYAQHCASCHGAERLGAMGPALLPESLERLRQAEASRVIAQGRPATQMAGFGAKLAADEVA